MLKSLRKHIGIFGARNVGKSSFINLISRQEISIVSDIPGTTTDPVKKFIEIPPLGPVVIIDTAGIDDVGTLGKRRVKSSLHALNSCDLAILLCDHQGVTSIHEKIISDFQKKKIPWFIVWNKIDLHPTRESDLAHLKNTYHVPVVEFTNTTDQYISNIIDTISSLLTDSNDTLSSILEDLVIPGDLIILVTPVDDETPKHRLILPQVQTIRDAIDNDCMALVLKEKELDTFLKKSNIIPKLVITDSQAFASVSKIVPKEIKLTSFSILFARQRADFKMLVSGTRSINQLSDNDKVLILESCSHHLKGDDIGTVKLPQWLSHFTKKKLLFDLKAGNDFLPENIDQYKLVIQCGGCMFTKREIKSRLEPFFARNIPVSNYGMSIAYTLGVFERSLECFNLNQKTI